MNKFIEDEESAAGVLEVSDDRSNRPESYIKAKVSIFDCVKVPPIFNKRLEIHIDQLRQQFKYN